MAQQPQPEVVFVDAPPAVPAALASVDAPVVGVDVERADADRYFRRAALVQVGVAGRCVLLDGTTSTTMPALDAFLGPDRVAVLHALENDVVPLAAHGVSPDRLADTALAAALLGLPTGLGPLLEQVLEVELTGDKDAFQRADWAARPIPPDMAAYAAGDVVHLPALWRELERRLRAADRRHWYEQELCEVADRATRANREWTKVKGSGRLTPEQRAILRAVWEAREALAREHDIAPNRLLHDEVLRDLAVDPPRTEAQLVRRSQRRRSLLRRHAEPLLAAVLAGQAAAPEHRPRTRRWTDTDRAVFDALRRRRAEVAEELGLDPGVLAPSQPLWGAVGADPADGPELCAAAALTGWRVDVLADPLWEAYVTTREDHDGT